MGDSGQGVRRKKVLKKEGLPRHVKDMSQEQLQATIRKKRECNAKALAIVEQMLEVHINADWFLDQLKFIDVGHFQDIIEERALCKLCGYPLCSENLKLCLSQQYHISTKYNKVYDITERKNFCSNQCYKASTFVKDQLLTSPLWIRDKAEFPVFQLLPLGSQSYGSGEEFDLGRKNNLKSEVTTIKNNEKFVSVTDYMQDSISKLSSKINDIEIKEKNEQSESERSGKHNEDKLKAQKITKGGSSIDITQRQSFGEENSGKIHVKLKDGVNVGFRKEIDNNKEEKLCSNTNATLQKSQSAASNTTVGNVHAGKHGELKENLVNRKEDKLKDRNSTKKCELITVRNSIINIEKCLHEWFTLNSMCFLFGNEKVKDLVCDKGECIKEYYKAVGKSSWDPVLQEQYEALCRKLDIMEMQEQRYDKEELQLKPLPDYSALKEESLKMDLKIQAFFHGKLNHEIPVGEKNEINTPSCVLPLIDIHAQNALRRRMVLDNLKRVLPDLLRTFGLSSRDISSEVRYLVGSFQLGAHNITFNPSEWNLLGLIIIKMLSIKDIRLKMVLETEQGIKCQTMILMTFQQDGGYLERLMVWLTDIDNIMKKK